MYQYLNAVVKLDSQSPGNLVYKVFNLELYENNKKTWKCLNLAIDIGTMQFVTPYLNPVFDYYSFKEWLEE